MSLKWQCEWNSEGRYYELNKGVKVPVRLFLSEKLFQESEEESRWSSNTTFCGIVTTGKTWYTCAMLTIQRENIGRELSHVLERVERGETIVILTGDVPFAELRPTPVRPSELRPFGLAAGQFVVPDDFDAPLPPEVLADFEGE